MIDEPGILDAAGFTPTAAVLDHGRRVAAFLAAAGIGAGDCVALLMRNGAPFVEATIGAQHLGAYPVPLNWHLAPDEIAYVLADCRAPILIADADLLTPLAALPADLRVIAIDAAKAEWRTLLDAHPPIDTPAAPPLPSMVYTSGTTGKPKGVRRTPPAPDEAAAMQRLRARIYDARPGMRALLSAPLYHSAPNFFALNTVRHGGLLVLQPRFDAEATLAAIERHRLTHAFMVPTMFVRLLALPVAVRARFAVGSLEAVLHAGAPCPVAVKAAMIDWWGPVMSEYYGSTELGPLTFCTSPEALVRPGTVGRALDGVTLTIRDEAGAALPAGAAGDLWVTSAAQADFTYQGDAGKRAAMGRGGELITGDIGYLDEAGYLFICDRRTDMIIAGGVNIYPAEIEAALAALPGVRDCAVIGVPDAEFGEAVLAIVEPAPGVQPTDVDLLAGLRRAIAGYKLPRRIVFTQALPRDENGKLVKRRLRGTFG